MSLYELDTPTRLIIQYGLIGRGYLTLPSPPTGAGGPLTDAAFARWRSDNSEEPKPDLIAVTTAQLAERICYEAARYTGLKEVIANAKWDDPKTPGLDERSNDLLRIMKPVPWQPGWAYCIAFCEGVVCEALRALGFREPQIKKFADQINAGVVMSANKIASLGLLQPQPARGAIWFARHGNSASGHAGIVRMANGATMGTTEANTSAGLEAGTNEAKEREGDWIDNKTRNARQNGKLRTMGFLHAEDILKMVRG